MELKCRFFFFAPFSVNLMMIFKNWLLGGSPRNHFLKSIIKLTENGAKNHRKSKKLLSFLISDWQAPDFASLASLASRHFLQ